MLKSSPNHLFTWRPGRLAKGTLAMTVGMGLRTLGQSAVFLIVTRVLGVREYGAYSAVIALAMICGGFSMVGASLIMLRNVACDARSFSDNWGRTLAAMLATAPPLFGLYLLLVWMLLSGRGSWDNAVCFGIAEIISSPLILATVHAYQGHELMSSSARLILVPIILKILAALALVLIKIIFNLDSLLTAWGALYMIASLVAVICNLRLVQRDFGVPLKPVWKGLGASIKEGWMFSFGSSAQKVYADVDKIMLARLATLEATGAYSAAYRIVDMSLVPMHALYASLTARYFRMGQGAGGLANGLQYGVTILPYPLVYALGAGLGISFLSYFLTFFLGGGYSDAATALRYLAWLPLVTIWRDLLQKTLVGAGHQGATLAAFSIAACSNLTLNLWLIPLYNWFGAIISTYISEIIMACALSVFVYYKLHKAK